MKMITLLAFMVFSLCFLTACEPEEQQGGGQLPERGVEVITNFIISERFDESGGRIVYVADAPGTEAGERQWCVNVRFVNSEGVVTIPLLVRQQQDEWRLERTPDRVVYEGYGCVWP
ncbi:MAG: hypothetical protein KJ069_31670 [Anaerolineae bacterium]|nr:hypothetical protein [Anaerolineae bacterium]